MAETSETSTLCLETKQLSDLVTEAMSAFRDRTDVLSVVETGQISAVETTQVSSAETTYI